MARSKNKALQNLTSDDRLKRLNKCVSVHQLLPGDALSAVVRGKRSGDRAAGEEGRGGGEERRGALMESVSLACSLPV
ncbi:hypothetical protein O3P69_016844 [Scylla paramamosain]|uniref:Uncharacterized protein n=1 Tax=Scylla paramamosain TaxID=85552 RepID=A0AAW0SZF4_SCYPA